MRTVDLAVYLDVLAAKHAGLAAQLERSRDRLRQASIEREAGGRSARRRRPSSSVWASFRPRRSAAFEPRSPTWPRRSGRSRSSRPGSTHSSSPHVKRRARNQLCWVWSAATNPIWPP